MILFFVKMDDRTFPGHAPTSFLQSVEYGKHSGNFGNFDNGDGVFNASPYNPLREHHIETTLHPTPDRNPYLAPPVSAIETANANRAEYLQSVIQERDNLSLLGIAESFINKPDPNKCKCKTDSTINNVAENVKYSLTGNGKPEANKTVVESFCAKHWSAVGSAIVIILIIIILFLFAMAVYGAFKIVGKLSTAEVKSYKKRAKSHGQVNFI